MHSIIPYIKNNFVIKKAILNYKNKDQYRPGNFQITSKRNRSSRALETLAVSWRTNLVKRNSMNNYSVVFILKNRLASISH